MNTPRIGTAREAADIVGVTRQMIYRYIELGYIRAWRIGRRRWQVDLDSATALNQPNFD